MLLLFSLPSHIRLFVVLWTAACQASLSLTISWYLPKFMFIASVMPSSHLILWCPLLLLPSIFPSIRDFFNESAVRIRWPKYWSFDFSISPSNEYSGFISLKIGGGDGKAPQCTCHKNLMNCVKGLYNKGNYIQHPVINHNGKNREKIYFYIYMYNSITYCTAEINTINYTSIK